jgi:hypothetical protein
LVETKFFTVTTPSKGTLAFKAAHNARLNPLTRLNPDEAFLVNARRVRLGSLNQPERLSFIMSYFPMETAPNADKNWLWERISLNQSLQIMPCAKPAFARNSIRS